MNAGAPVSSQQLVVEYVQAADFRRATFGGAVRGAKHAAWQRVVVRPVEVRGEPLLQFSYFDARKNIVKNYPSAEAEARLQEVLALGFANIHLETDREAVDIRTTKKGQVLVGRRPLDPPATVPTAHNRVKDVPLPEGQSNRLLEALGILTRTGQVRPTMRAKFTQINEFLKHLNHVLDDADLRSLGRPVDILDCGCGASYLTLAVHHYLNDVLGLPARILGVDVNAEVIRKSMERRDRLGAAAVDFACAAITGVTPRADIVLALHACDTATDDALAQAVRAEARLVLSVPCCHHHLNEQLRAAGPAESLRPLLRHGLLQQRTADIVTDAFRALALRIMGYRTDVVEFISPEHTARNLMIRGVRGLPPGDPALVAEYLELRRFWGVTPYIEQALGEPLKMMLALPARGSRDPGSVA